jgi:hypothetical protein
MSTVAKILSTNCNAMYSALDILSVGYWILLDSSYTIAPCIVLGAVRARDRKKGLDLLCRLSMLKSRNMLTTSV